MIQQTSQQPHQLVSNANAASSYYDSTPGTYATGNQLIPDSNKNSSLSPKTSNDLNNNINQNDLYLSNKQSFMSCINNNNNNKVTPSIGSLTKPGVDKTSDSAQNSDLTKVSSNSLTKYSSAGQLNEIKSDSIYDGVKLENDLPFNRQSLKRKNSGNNNNNSENNDSRNESDDGDGDDDADDDLIKGRNDEKRLDFNYTQSYPNYMFYNSESNAKVFKPNFLVNETSMKLPVQSNHHQTFYPWMKDASKIVGYNSNSLVNMQSSSLLAPTTNLVSPPKSQTSFTAIGSSSASSISSANSSSPTTSSNDSLTSSTSTGNKISKQTCGNLQRHAKNKDSAMK